MIEKHVSMLEVPKTLKSLFDVTQSAPFMQYLSFSVRFFGLSNLYPLSLLLSMVFSSHPESVFG